MGSPHLFHLFNSQLQTTCEGGRRIDVTADQLPALSGMALSLLELNPAGFREPHWHPNANELGYCLKGQALMTIFTPEAGHETFVINPGEVTFVPMGYIHDIQNIGSTPFKMLICFNHERPEDINLSSSISVMPKHVLGSTFNLPETFFQKMRQDIQPIFIGQEQSIPQVPLAYATNPFKLNLNQITPQIQNAGGWVKMSNGFLFPKLEGLAIYNLLLNEKGVREPHWHPNAGELNYLISGTARITLLSPHEVVDTFDLKAGDLSFMPRGYFHHIENTGEDKAHFAVFFNHHFPSDIGLSGCLGAYPNTILAHLCDVNAEYLKTLPKLQHDLLIVGGG